MKNLVPAPRHPQLDFTPVPRKYRYDGWTPERQRAFIAALAETGSVTAAAQRINMSAEGAYYLRRQPGADGFRAAWAAALDHGVQRLTDIAIDRAIEGVPSPIFWRGEQVGERRIYNHRLLMFVLRHHVADRYGGQSIGSGTRHPDTIAREAAEHCPVCKERAEEAAAPDDSAADTALIDSMLEHYVAKLANEARHRSAGEFAAADFILRQLTHIELILVHAGRTAELIDAASTIPPKSPGAGPTQLFANPVSAHLDALRRDVWDRTAAPPRPPLRFPERESGGAFWCGPTHAERSKARRDVEARIAQAYAEWDAAMTEDGWERWKLRRSDAGES